MAYPQFPDRVYIDTSFLVRLISYTTDPKDKNNKKCKKLFDHFNNRGIAMIASFLTLEEAIHTFLFKGKKSGLNYEAKKRNYSHAKDFRLKDPKIYSKVYSNYKNTALLTLRYSIALGIKFNFPVYKNPHLTNATMRVNNFAAGLLRRYDCLDTMDAFHAATAKVMNIKMLISCDRDFDTVSEIDNYNPC